MWMACLVVTLALPGAEKTPAKAVPLSDSQVRLADLCVQGMKDGRERLRSGVFRARGRRVVDEALLVGKGPLLPETKWEVYCAFDHAKELLRLDWVQPMPWVRSPKEMDPKQAAANDLRAALGDGTAEVHMVTHKYVRTPRHGLAWTSGSQHVLNQSPPGDAWKHRPAGLDVRALGLLLMVDFDKGKGFPAVVNNLAKMEFTEVGEDDKGLCHLVCVFGKDKELQRQLWLDRTNGYTPVRHELRYLDRSGPVPTWQAKPRETSEVTWEQVSAVWIPRTFSLTLERAPGVKASVELAFEWEAVNQPVPEEQFTPDGMDLPPRTQIVSWELGKPVVLGYTGKKLERSTDSTPPPGTPSLATTLGRLLLLAVVVIVVALLSWRRWTSHRAVDGTSERKP